MLSYCQFGISLSTIVLNSRDWHGIYGFLCLKNSLYKNVSFKYWPFIYWYEVIGTINLFKQPKCTLELKLSNFKCFVNCKHFVCLPDHNNWSTAQTTACMVSILSQYDSHEPLLFSWHLLSSSVSRLLCILHDCWCYYFAQRY